VREGGRGEEEGRGGDEGKSSGRRARGVGIWRKEKKKGGRGSA